MHFSSTNENTTPLHIQLEILTVNSDETELALASAVRRDCIDELRNTGYSVHSLSTGQRSSDIAIQIITTLTDIATNAWAHKEVFERVLTDAVGLVTVCTSVAPVAKTVVGIFKKRTAKTSELQEPLKITIEIDGKPVTVEAANLEQAEAGLKLAQQFHSTHPTVAQQVTAQSNVKIKAHLPQAQRRKRR